MLKITNYAHFHNNQLVAFSFLSSSNIYFAIDAFFVNFLMLKSSILLLANRRLSPAKEKPLLNPSYSLQNGIYESADFLSFPVFLDISKNLMSHFVTMQ